MRRIAGPIERPQNLLGQFRVAHAWDYGRVVAGLKRMAWGFFKKLVVADRVGVYVNDVFAAPQAFTGLHLTIATVFFAYQIYCDFSGYSDIAIGSAQVLGFRLSENFNQPYRATSVADFWRRWHLSLSTWFRDYVYVPLGGGRVGAVRWARNILVTFGLSGLWHGANWTYVVWGLLNGAYVIAGRATRPLRDACFGFVRVSEASGLRWLTRWATTMALTGVGWVIFRAQSLGDAGYILTHWARRWDFSQIVTQRFYLKHFPPAVAAILVLEIVQWLDQRRPVGPRVAALPFLIRWPAYVGFVCLIVTFGVFSSDHFIYFQF